MRVGDLICFNGKRPGSGAIETMIGRITNAWVQHHEETDHDIDYVSVANEYGSWTKRLDLCWEPDAVTQLGEVTREDR